MSDSFDPIDGPLGRLAHAAGRWAHGPLLALFWLTGADNLDGVPYHFLRLAAGYLALLLPFALALGLCWGGR